MLLCSEAQQLKHQQTSQGSLPLHPLLYLLQSLHLLILRKMQTGLQIPLHPNPLQPRLQPRLQPPLQPPLQPNLQPPQLALSLLLHISARQMLMSRSNSSRSSNDSSSSNSMRVLHTLAETLQVSNSLVKIYLASLFTQVSTDHLLMLRRLL